MNDLETFRAALQAPMDTGHDPLDVGRIMQQGGRLRRRRRLLAGAAGVATALVLVTGGVQAGRAFAPPAPGDVPAAPGRPSASAVATPAPDDATPVPGPPAVDASERSRGDRVRTGVSSGDREVVLYLAPVDDPALPEVDFGVMAGLRARDGGVTPRLLSNEIEGSWRAAGFHAVSAATNVEGDDIPAFGYYVGPATKITAGKGEKATARQARWSEDPSVVLFWFDPADVPEDFTVSNLAAFDRAGKKLPTGNAAVGVG